MWLANFRNQPINYYRENKLRDEYQNTWQGICLFEDGEERVGADRAAAVRGQRDDAPALDKTDPDGGVGAPAIARPGHLLHTHDG